MQTSEEIKISPMQISLDMLLYFDLALRSLSADYLTSLNKKRLSKAYLLHTIGLISYLTAGIGSNRPLQPMCG